MPKNSIQYKKCWALLLLNLHQELTSDFDRYAKLSFFYFHIHAAALHKTHPTNTRALLGCFVYGVAIEFQLLSETRRK